ncbi:MAG: hypothetical protein ACRDZ7_09070 [Acidimicrobiia bacterium]
MSHQQDAQFLTGLAWRDTMPGRPPTLHVTAVWVTPTAGYELELVPHPPGINPEIVLVELIERKPIGFTLPVVTRVVTPYHAPAGEPVKEVTILPNGPSLPVLEVTSEDETPPAAEQITGGGLFPLANHYELYGDGLTVVYSTTSIDGTPTLSYNGRTYVGDDLRVEESALGNLVTVLLGRDTEGISFFTLVASPVRFTEDDREFPVSTLGITTLYRIPYPPHFAWGQLLKYKHTALDGKATIINP